MKRDVLGVTLFEAQIARNLLFSDHGQLLEKLALDFKLIIFTNENLRREVEYTISSYHNLDIELRIVSKAKMSPLEYVLVSLCKLHGTSSSIERGIWVNSRDQRRAIPNSFFRLLIRKLIKGRKTLINLARKLLSICVPRQIDFKQFALLDGKVEGLLITSLTNYMEDIRLGIYARSVGIKVLGTPRSWDNLSSHGSLPFIPDKVLVHSAFMMTQARDYQKIKESKLVMGVAPNYQSHFQLSKKKEETRPKQYIVYACMGSKLNPDESNLIEFLAESMVGRFSEYVLVFLKHPIFEFALPDRFQNLPNFLVREFPYEKSSLRDYYEFLIDAELVIAGGTSAALDATFLGVPLAFVGFDIKQQDYWKSALRYLDKHTHTKEFVKRYPQSIVQNTEHLLRRIETTKTSFPIENLGEVREFFCGNQNIDLASSIISEFKELLYAKDTQ